MTKIYYNPQVQTQTAKNKNETKEQVAIGVGATAGLASKAKTVANGTIASGKTLHSMLDTVTINAKKASETANEAEKLLNTFKGNVGKYTKDILTRIEKFKDHKILGKLIQSPAMKSVASACGGALAFFVLVTGVNKTINTGAIAMDDLKSKLNIY